MMGLYVNAKSERYAYFSVFWHNWLPFLLRHVEIGALLQNSIIKHLNCNVSAIHSWYWLLLSFQISHQAKTWTWLTTKTCSWLDCHMFACEGHLHGRNVLLLNSLLCEVLRVPWEKVCYRSMSLYHIIVAENLSESSAHWRSLTIHVFSPPIMKVRHA